MIHVAVCDDHRIVADGLKALLKHRKDLKVVGEALNSKELFLLLESSPLPIDVVLMDIGLNEESGIQLTAQLISKYPQLGIIALTMLNDYTSIAEMTRAGARGYLVKNTSVEELCQAIKTIADGGRYTSREISDILMNQLAGVDFAAAETEVSLNDREKTILQYLGNGLTTKAIAEKIFLSEETVKWYRKNLLARFNQPNMTALIKWALKKGLIE